MREGAYVAGEIHQDLAGCVEHDVVRRSVDQETLLHWSMDLLIERLGKSCRRSPVFFPGKDE